MQSKLVFSSEKYKKCHYQTKLITEILLLICIAKLVNKEKNKKIKMKIIECKSMRIMSSLRDTIYFYQIVQIQIWLSLHYIRRFAFNQDFQYIFCLSYPLFLLQLIISASLPVHMLNTLDPNQIIYAFNKFNKSWKEFTNKVQLSATLNEVAVENNSRLFNEQNIDDLFNQSKPKPLKVQYKQSQIFNQGSLPFLEFFKAVDRSDILLSGLPILPSKSKNNDLEPNYTQKQTKCIDLTKRFKQLYIVGKIIGEGAYASVRVGVYKPYQKKVALKVYQKIRLAKLQRKKSFLRQAKILSFMNHENIVKFFNVIQSNNHLNIVMEYIEGISLNNFVKAHQNKKLNEKQCRIIIRGLASALHHMRGLNISHRDIKLQNVIIDKDLNPKLIDFGFSTWTKPGQKLQLFCGTPSYMAPQIIQRKECCGMKADIWALGVLFFIIFTGIFPFKGANDQELHHKIINLQYQRTQISHIKELSQLIGSMLKINPDERITPYEILHHSWITGQSKIINKKSVKVDRNQSYDPKKRSNTAFSQLTDKKSEIRMNNKTKLITQLEKQAWQKTTIRQCLNRTVKPLSPSLQNRRPTSKQIKVLKGKKVRKEEDTKRKYLIRKQENKKLTRSKSKIKLI